MRLPIPPPGRPQPLILLFTHFLVKKADPPSSEARPDAIVAARRRRKQKPIARAGTECLDAGPARRGQASHVRARAATHPAAAATSTPSCCHRARRSSTTLEDAGVPLPPAELERTMRVEPARARGIPRPHRSDAARRAADAESQGRALRRRQARRSSPAPCKAIPTDSAFSCPTTARADLFLSPREMHKVLHGDRATARRIGTDRRGRPEGEIVDVLERANRTIVGRLHEERGIVFVVAENRRINQDLLVPPDERGGAKAGHVVDRRDRRAALAAARGHRPRRRGARQLHRPGHGDRDRAAQARPAARVLGRRRSARPSGCRRTCARRTTRAGSTSPHCRSSRSTARRRRISTTPCSASAQGEGFRLIVAIADVSHYVRDGDALDHDARERGTSVYFPRRVIPMLPEALSNELCSLKPLVDRLCMACEMDVERRRRDQELQVLSGGDALAGAAHLHAGLGGAVGQGGEAAARDEGAAAAARDALRALPRAQGGARGARRHRLRQHRDAARIRRARQDRRASCRSCATTRTS